jgi:hypothetical protein
VVTHRRAEFIPLRASDYIAPVEMEGESGVVKDA